MVAVAVGLVAPLIRGMRRWREGRTSQQQAEMSESRKETSAWPSVRFGQQHSLGPSCCLARLGLLCLGHNSYNTDLRSARLFVCQCLCFGRRGSVVGRSDRPSVWLFPLPHQLRPIGEREHRRLELYLNFPASCSLQLITWPPREQARGGVR